jgi:choline dehydrogenase-like flavoprotein
MKADLENASGESNGLTRREFVKGALMAAGAVATSTYSADTAAGTPPSASQYDTIVVGTGFGATMTALSLSREYLLRGLNKRILMIERGTWWTTPIETVQDKAVATYDFLLNKKQPVQYWSAPDDLLGLLDMAARYLRTQPVSAKKNPAGLFDFTYMGGVSVLRANGVGGGSLVYANVTIEPPKSVFEDDRWRSVWIDSANRDWSSHYYELARKAIGVGVIHALFQRDANESNRPRPIARSLRVWDGTFKAYDPSTRRLTVDISKENGQTVPPSKERVLELATGAPDGDLRTLKPGTAVWASADPGNKGYAWAQAFFHVNTELSNVAMRSVELKDSSASSTKRFDPSSAAAGLWLDRTRIFQSEIGSMKPPPDEWGTVDSSISDKSTFDGSAANFCERQGRCILGCLPGARFTLNKQLMRAALGNFNKADPTNPAAYTPPALLGGLDVRAMTEVTSVGTNPGGGYSVHVRNGDGTRETLAADRVVVAAGCVGSIELLLRSRSDLPQLSDRVGYGFSPNGDYLAFLDGVYGDSVEAKKRKQRLNLCKGPVTTSFAHFNSGDAKTFHTIEDNGIPKPLARIAKAGAAGKPGRGGFFLKALFRGAHSKIGPNKVFPPDTSHLVNQIVADVVNEQRDAEDRARESAHDLVFLVPQRSFLSGEELLGRTMCIAAMGRDAAKGRIWIEQNQLVAERTDHIPFFDDPIYEHIRGTLKRFAFSLTGDPSADFVNPLLIDEGVLPKTIGSSHPLGGCCVGLDAKTGVVNASGQVFKKDASGGGTETYENLYVVDGSIVPTSLGVNPSLTIAAVALKIADDIIRSLRET